MIGTIPHPMIKFLIKKIPTIHTMAGSGGFDMHLYGTQAVNEKGHLTIGGVDTTELAATYGTPQFVYDLALFRERARGFVDTFEKAGVKAQVAYASKAFLISSDLSSGCTGRFIGGCRVRWRTIYSFKSWIPKC